MKVRRCGRSRYSALRWSAFLIGRSLLRHPKSVVSRPSSYARFRAAPKQVMSRFSVLSDRR